MISFPNAKINLGLNIILKRDDGYHNLETVFYPLPIEDALEIIISEEKDEDTFIASGLKVTTIADENLVMKALKLMRNLYDIPALEIRLLKKIPSGAGIGGGSSNAAFMLKLLNTKFELGASSQQLADIAVQLGADCPFFIYNKPMYATGIGEVLEDIDLPLSDYSFVLIKPDIHVSTKDAFARIVPQETRLSVRDIVKLPIEEWKDKLTNDFEKSIFPMFPTIEHIKNKLYALGALYASMSGSGSSVYAIFNKKTDLKHHFSDCYVWEQSKN